MVDFLVTSNIFRLFCTSMYTATKKILVPRTLLISNSLIMLIAYCYFSPIAKIALVLLPICSIASTFRPSFSNKVLT